MPVALREGEGHLAWLAEVYGDPEYEALFKLAREAGPEAVEAARTIYDCYVTETVPGVRRGLQQISAAAPIAYYLGACLRPSAA